MADDLATFRRANIGEVIQAKETPQAALAALPDAVLVIESGGAVSSANPRAIEIIDGVATENAVSGSVTPERDEAQRSRPRSRGELAQRVRSVDFSGRDRYEDRQKRKERAPTANRPDSEEGPATRTGAVLVLSRPDGDCPSGRNADGAWWKPWPPHELRTPLTTLKMTLLMLKERASSSSTST